MSKLTEAQIIRDVAGNPAFAVLPYQEYLALKQHQKQTAYVPDDVVQRVVQLEMTPIRAWREHLGLTQMEVAKELGISQSAYAQQENKQKLRRKTRIKIAAVLGIDEQQMHF